MRWVLCLPGISVLAVSKGFAKPAWRTSERDHPGVQRPNWQTLHGWLCDRLPQQLCGRSGDSVGTLQFETIALVGSNLGLENLDYVARLNYMCNDFGLDTIETGAALGVAIEGRIG